ncbi:MAG: hypothetical protein HY658_13905, partial [Actinobacteria bacterium]|nr:hypothetical protein [Actinomycetota bacterium]
MESPCGYCGITSAGADLLLRGLYHLRRTNPNDSSWTADICEGCGRVTAIRDLRDMWAVGHPVRPADEPPARPVATRPPEPPRPEPVIVLDVPLPPSRPGPDGDPDSRPEPPPPLPPA